MNRLKGKVKKTVAGFVRIGGELLNQPGHIRTSLNARPVLSGSHTDVADQHLRENVVVVVSNFQSDLFIGLDHRRETVSAIVLQVSLLELIVPALPNQNVAVQVEPARQVVFCAQAVFLRLLGADAREGSVGAEKLRVKTDLPLLVGPRPKTEQP